MRVMALALGGCLSANPSYGITSDTGGHITYVLATMRALAQREDIEGAEIVTRLFDDASLGAIHAERSEILSAKLRITRIDSGNTEYLSKEGLACDLPAFTAALIADLQQREVRPDIIHAHFADAAKVALAIREAFGIPFIYTAHSLGMDKASAMSAEHLELATRLSEEDSAIKTADAVVGSSRDECERQLMSYPSALETRIHRIRPGIDQSTASEADIDSAKALVAPFLRDLERPIVLAIARPVKKKNLVALVKAFAGNQSLVRNANLVILPGLRRSVETGEAEQIEVMRRLVDAIDEGDLYGIAAYPRKHTQAQVRGLYALARQTGGVFVNPALTEPFGLTILEAAVYGLPVVATRNGGPSDIVKELGHGKIIDPSDEQGIGDTIAGLIADKAMWITASENAQSRIKTMRWDNYAAGLVKLARSILYPVRPPVMARKPDKLVLCDIDNTLTGCRRSAERFATFIRSRNDIVFGVATGRSLVEAQRLVREWNLPVPEVWVTSVGSEIHWGRPGSLELDSEFSVLIDHGWNAEAVEIAMSDLREIIPQSGVNQRCHKRSFFATGNCSVSIVNEQLRLHGIQANVIHSHGSLLDILPAKAGKGPAMNYIAKALRIPRENIFAAGDSGNDLDMLEACHNAIVVANGEPGLQKLKSKPTVYFAEKPYAAGALEGMLKHMKCAQDRANTEIAA